MEKKLFTYSISKQSSARIYDSEGHELSVNKTIWIPPLPDAQYVNNYSGECVVVKLRGKDTRIALTPENSSEFVKKLSSRLT